MSDIARPLLSVVIPICNEGETLSELERRLVQVLEELSDPYEILFVNDGSTDGSLDRLREFAARNRSVRVIDFSRNFGHQAALFAGICRASGDAIVLMDGDLQDPPEFIPQMLELWREGFKVVYAVRKRRKERLLKRAAYAAYYRLLNRLAYIDIPLDSGDFSLIDREVAGLLETMPERNKFLRGLRSWVGFAQVSLPYEREARFAGAPKYTLRKLVKLALDGVVSYSYVPLRISFAVGALVSSFAFLLGAVYFVQRLLADYYIPQGFTTLAILVLFLGGVQLLSIGLLGEYIGRIYDEVKRRPEYVERELIGFNDNQADRTAGVSDRDLDRSSRAAVV
jgi:glycosyltransferase involved in cell wall biosynthesis